MAQPLVMLSRQPRGEQEFPAGQGLVCPICGTTEVRGTVEEVKGIALLNDDHSYLGSTDMDWDDQRPMLSTAGDPLVLCEAYHPYFAVGYASNGRGISARELCRAVSDVSDGPSSEPVPWLVCDLPKGHTGPHTEVDVQDLPD